MWRRKLLCCSSLLENEHLNHTHQNSGDGQHDKTKVFGQRMLVSNSNSQQSTWCSIFRSKFRNYILSAHEAFYRKQMREASKPLHRPPRSSKSTENFPDALDVGMNSVLLTWVLLLLRRNVFSSKFILSSETASEGQCVRLQFYR